MSKGTGSIWDVFCRVIDNYGDIGVCWRLARQLAAAGEQVRLWLDDASALTWMATGAAPQGIQVLRWDESEAVPDCGHVVIEAFGCELPPAFIQRMAARMPAPAWINLEYLSAECYVERSHGLRSPRQSGPGQGLAKHFFYPGFTPRTGGLLREPGLLDEISRFDAAAWLQAQGLVHRPGERLVSLFAYPNTALPQLLQRLGDRATLLLACPGTAQQQLAQLELPAQLRWQALPYLSQDDYDRLLWACDLNLVRGEDSFVRAQWAGKPMLWQIYPQHDGAHGPKLEALLDRYLHGAKPTLAADTRQLWRAWNGLAPWPASPLPVDAEAQDHARRWPVQLALQADLLSQLRTFLDKPG